MKFSIWLDADGPVLVLGTAPRTAGGTLVRIFDAPSWEAAVKGLHHYHESMRTDPS